MVIYRGKNLSLDELGKLPEGMYRIIKEIGRNYNPNFIPPGPAICRDRLKKVIESQLDSDKAVIIDDFVTNSPFRHIYDNINKHKLKE